MAGPIELLPLADWRRQFDVNVFGLIAVAGAKIWVDNRVDFADNTNLIVAAVTLVLGTGDFTLKFGGAPSGLRRADPAYSVSRWRQAPWGRFA